MQSIEGPRETVSLQLREPVTSSPNEVVWIFVGNAERGAA
jgi:hypothetical protein